MTKRTPAQARKIAQRKAVTVEPPTLQSPVLPKRTFAAVRPVTVAPTDPDRFFGDRNELGELLRQSRTLPMPPPEAHPSRDSVTRAIQYVGVILCVPAHRVLVPYPHPCPQCRVRAEEIVTTLQLQAADAVDAREIPRPKAAKLSRDRTDPPLPGQVRLVVSWLAEASCRHPGPVVPWPCPACLRWAEDTVTVGLAHHPYIGPSNVQSGSETLTPTSSQKSRKTSSSGSRGTRQSSPRP